jgi:hypothetical protein
MTKPVSADDLQAINHINYVSNSMHELTDELYEDLMDRDHEQTKLKAKNIINIMNELIKSLSDEI